MYYCVLLADDTANYGHSEFVSRGCLFAAPVQHFQQCRALRQQWSTSYSEAVVTDFYALMHACMQAFNDGKQLDTYLRLTYDIAVQNHLLLEYLVPIKTSQH